MPVYGRPPLMPFIQLKQGPSSRQIFYREFGLGFPLLFLHSGWGYEIYPFDAQIREFQESFRILIPDRTGYGRSSPLSSFPKGFHRVAAQEMFRFLDSMNIQKTVLWGHSDGAISAVWMGLEAPGRVAAIILEAIHYDRCKKNSRKFFETMVSDPAKFGKGVMSVLARDHGEDYWPILLVSEGKAWLEILDNCQDATQDLYGGRLSELQPPALLIHGAQDPRTERGELKAIQRLLPRLRIHILAEAGHSPHSELQSAERSNRIAREFLSEVLL